MSNTPEEVVELELYERMCLIRLFEEAAEREYRDGGIPGPLHLSIGQEAVAVGACAGLGDADQVVSTHRGHHHCLAKGVPADRLMAELMGRQAGWARGRGGSMHVVDHEHGLLGTNGIVGGGLPIAVGAAYGLMVEGEGNVAVCFFGEGAAATGNFGEALNLAALWRLPLVFVCENNQYVELASQVHHVAGEIWRRATGYGFEGVRVDDGNDVLAVEEAAATAVHTARSGGGPTLIEAVTYRLRGHHADDPAKYQPEEEREMWRDRYDPLTLLERDLSDDDARSARERADRVVADALEYARASEPADFDTLALDHLTTSAAS